MESSKMSSKYQSETLEAYQDTDRARAYKQQTKQLTWARFVTSRELRVVQTMLSDCGIEDREVVLDAPCGTGIIGPLFGRERVRVVALDIALEMMELAREEYDVDRFSGFVRGDMTALPFRERTFVGAFVLGFLHRIPELLQEQIIVDLVRVVDRFLIITYSVDNKFQRLKRRVLQLIWGRQYTAPVPRSLTDITSSLKAQGLTVIKCRWVFPVLSSSVVILAHRK